jgi:AraC-like DNA-binding protein
MGKQISKSRGFLLENNVGALTSIKKIIEENAANYHFTVLHLAREMGISYSYLYEIVYGLFGMSPHRLIETIRLERAIHLIAEGKMLIKIYRKLGYGNIRTFREAFYKRLNMNYSRCRLSFENCNSKDEVIRKHIASLWEIRDD